MPIEFGSFSLGSVAGGIVGAIAGHYLTKSRNIEDRFARQFNVSAEELRNALLMSINKIENGQVVFRVIKEDFPAQREIMLRFTHHIRGSALIRFKADWDEYEQWYKDVCCRSAAECIYPPDGEEFQRKRNIHPSKFIDKLLVHTSSK